MLGGKGGHEKCRDAAWVIRLEKMASGKNSGKHLQCKKPRAQVLGGSEKNWAYVWERVVLTRGPGVEYFKAPSRSTLYYPPSQRMPKPTGNDSISPWELIVDASDGIRSLN